MKKVSFEQSVKIQNRAASFGLSIPVIDSWECEGVYGVMVMKRLKENLKTKLIREHDIHLLRTLYTLVYDLHAHHISHGDIKLENVMVEDQKMYLIDFDFGNDEAGIKEKEMDLIALADVTKNILTRYS